MTHRYRATASQLFLLLGSIAGIFLIWFIPATRAIEVRYQEIAVQLSAPTIAATASIGDDSLAVPDWTLFTPGHVWSLVSKDKSLSPSYTPELVDAPVPHTKGVIRIATSIEKPLQSLFTAAEDDGVLLMLSSAYRSSDDQQAIYDAYLHLHGQSYVDSYVAKPGQSEHQTGLAVDIASKTNECSSSADKCSLDYAAIVWLRQNAPRFGFIQRYPSGKQSITGVAGEAWHYRYVGTELGRLLDKNNLTFDEFVQQIAPGYAR